MKPNSAPGPHGLTAYFYQKYRSIVGKDITSTILNILNGFSAISFISLIPKTKKPKNTGELKPIALCNVFFFNSTKICIIYSKDGNEYKKVLAHSYGGSTSSTQTQKCIPHQNIITIT
jgi:hypothetical protein